MLRALNAGAINVSIKNLTEGIEGCRVGGFDCLALSPGLIADQSAEEITEELFEAMVAPGAWGIPFNWRGADEEYNAGLEAMRSQVERMALVRTPVEIGAQLAIWQAQAFSRIKRISLLPQSNYQLMISGQAKFRGSIRG